MTGDEYMADITARRSDRAARSAFLDLAEALAPRGSSIFDFGAGPGLDAKHYARKGFKVLTYDVDPAMCQCLLAYCREEIERQQVIPCNALPGRGHKVLDDTAHPRDINLVTANFAPFNLVAEPEACFRQLHGLLGTGGQLLISVLNPYFFGDARYTWWWRNIPRLTTHGEYAVAGGSGPIHRRSPGRFGQLAAPYFKLQSVRRGLPGRAYHRGVLRRPLLITGRYLFLLFDRCD